MYDKPGKRAFAAPDIRPFRRLLPESKEKVEATDFATTIQQSYLFLSHSFCYGFNPRHPLGKNEVLEQVKALSLEGRT
jgi:hypothetical protein